MIKTHRSVSGIEGMYPQKPTMKRPQQQGMTLIEILIVVVVIAIITAIAVPNILNSIQNEKQSYRGTGHRGDARRYEHRLDRQRDKRRTHRPSIRARRLRLSGLLWQLATDYRAVCRKTGFQQTAAVCFRRNYRQTFPEGQ